MYSWPMSVAAERLFQTVPKTNLLGLLGPDGPDVVGTRKFLGFTDQDLASATSALQVTQVRSLNQMPREVKDRFEQIATICELVAEHLGSRDKAVMWFKTVNPMIGIFTPRDMLRMGRFRALHRLVLEALDGI